MAHIDDCRKFIECLSAHFDGELDGDLLVEFEEHLKTCEKAQVLVRTFERTIILHSRTRQREVPADVHQRLLAAIGHCMDKENQEEE
jgi:anti-sigma factor RsiW